MKNLILSSLFILLFSGCSLSLFNSFRRIPETSIDKKDILPWFNGDANHFLFHANVDIYSSHFGGIMAIKPFTTDSYRAIYITEIGIKIFDMEFFRNGDFKLHYCMDAINRMSVIKTLKNDIGLMLVNISEKNKIKFLQDSENGKTLIKSKDPSGIKYHILNDKKNRVQEIILTKRLQKKMNILFYSSNGIELDSVKITHFNIKLNIQLSNYNETKSDVPK